MMIVYMTYMITKMFDILDDIYDDTKHYLFLIFAVAILMVGIAKRHFITIVFASILMIIATGVVSFYMEGEENGKEVFKAKQNRLVESKKVEQR